MAIVEPTPVIPEWSFGERLAKARDLAEMTQAQMAVELTARGIKKTESAVAAWEINRNQPRRLHEVVRVWAAITGVDYRWLLTGEPQNAKILKVLPGAASTQPPLPGLGPGPTLTLLAPYSAAR